MQFDLQKCRNNTDVNCVLLSDISVCGRPCWLNNRLRILIAEGVSVFFVGKISSHLEWASTTTRKLRPFMGPAKSTSTHDYGCSEYVQCKSIINGGLFCASMQGTQLLIVFRMSEWMLGQYSMLWAMAFIWLIQDVLSVIVWKKPLLCFVGVKTRSANIRHLSMMAGESLHRWYCYRSQVRSDGHEHLRNWIIFWSIWSRCTFG